MSCNSETLPYRIEETCIPFISSLGPFHDETILSSIDKLLYILGVQNMATAKSTIKRTRFDDEEDTFKTCDTCRTCAKSAPACTSSNCAIPQSRPNALLNSAKQPIHPTPCTKNSAKNVHQTPFSPPASPPASPPPLHPPHHSQKPTTQPGKESSLSNSVRFLEHPMVQDLICPICGNLSGGKPDTSKIQSLIQDYEEYQKSPVKMMLRRSTSLCSAAVRKLKNVFSDSSQAPKTQAEMDWFWTRRRDEGSHQVLEIYENSDISKYPSQTRLKENLSLILVVTPNGGVVPFEPLKK